MVLKPGVWEDKTSDFDRRRQDTGDVDRRTSPEQGEEPTSAEVMTVLFVPSQKM